MERYPEADPDAGANQRVHRKICAGSAAR